MNKREKPRRLKQWTILGSVVYTFRNPILSEELVSFAHKEQPDNAGKGKFVNCKDNKKYETQN
jgi:hypothetical protein